MGVWGCLGGVWEVFWGSVLEPWVGKGGLGEFVWERWRGREWCGRVWFGGGRREGERAEDVGRGCWGRRRC